MAERAIGTKLKIGEKTIGGLTSISGVDISADTRDVTNLDAIDRYRKFIGGLIDGGEVSAEGQLSETGADEVAIVELIGGDPEPCEISFPNGAKWAFDAIVTGFSTEAETDGELMFSVTLKVSGKPTLTAGPAS